MSLASVGREEMCLYRQREGERKRPDSSQVGWHANICSRFESAIEYEHQLSIRAARVAAIGPCSRPMSAGQA